MGVPTEIQGQLDRMAIGHVMQICKESIGIHDEEAVLSAFCSEIAAGEEQYLSYFPYLRTRKARHARARR